MIKLIALILVFSTIGIQAAPQFFCPTEDILGLLAHRSKDKILDISFLEQKEDLLEKSDTFEAITSFHSFQWVEDPEGTLKKIVASLQPGGECLIAAFPKQSPYLELFQQTAQEYGQNVSFFGIEEYRKTVLSLGCKIQFFAVKRSVAVYQNLEELKEEARAFFPNAEERILNLFAQRAAERSWRSSGKILIPSKELVLLFSKSEH